MKRRNQSEKENRNLKFLDSLPQPEPYPLGKRTDEEMSSLKEYKLSEIKITEESPASAYPTFLELTPERLLHHFMPNTSKVRRARTRSQLDWMTILIELGKFAETSSPHQAKRLFGPELKKDYTLLEKTDRSLRKGLKTGSRGRHKGRFSRKGMKSAAVNGRNRRVDFGAEDDEEKVDTFFQEEILFEEKLCQVMRMGLEVDPNEWNTCLKGYAVGFWLAKLYNQHGYEDDELPNELNQTKQHFLELYGYQYEECKIVIDYKLA